MNRSPLTLPKELLQGRGRIELILGPMFSGKTTELIRRIDRYQCAKFRCLVFKYAGDNRYSDTDVVTHDRKCIPAVSASYLLGHCERTKDFDVIGIDEGQFFPDLVTFSEKLANEGKTVVVAALDGTYQRIGFRNVLELVPLSESVTKLNAVCMTCCNDASFTQRICGSTEVELIGGADKYKAVCRECHNGRLSIPKQKRTPLKELHCNPVSYESSPIKALFVD